MCWRRLTTVSGRAPIVAVPKKDGSVHVCGDYKVTVNPALDVNQYPMPRPSDLFATLASGKYFTKSDLTHAYNHIGVGSRGRGGQSPP